MEPTFDSDGYPSEATLDEISEWDCKDMDSLIRFVKKAWSYPDRARYIGKMSFLEGCIEFENVWYFSTGGWSGNESLIDSLQKNAVFWMVCWVQSIRGGHFYFNVKP